MRLEPLFVIRHLWWCCPRHCHLLFHTRSSNLNGGGGGAVPGVVVGIVVVAAVVVDVEPAGC